MKSKTPLKECWSKRLPEKVQTTLGRGAWIDQWLQDASKTPTFIEFHGRTHTIVGIQVDATEIMFSTMVLCYPIEDRTQALPPQFSGNIHSPQHSDGSLRDTLLYQSLFLRHGPASLIDLLDGDSTDYLFHSLLDSQMEESLRRFVFCLDTFKIPASVFKTVFLNEDTQDELNYHFCVLGSEGSQSNICWEGIVHGLTMQRLTNINARVPKVQDQMLGLGLKSTTS